MGLMSCFGTYYNCKSKINVSSGILNDWMRYTPVRIKMKIVECSAAP